MDVAKASLEASVRYLAKGVSGFNDINAVIGENAPLCRNVGQDQVGDTTLFFISDLSHRVTGEVMHIDSGYHILG